MMEPIRDVIRDVRRLNACDGEENASYRRKWSERTFNHCRRAWRSEMLLFDDDRWKGIERNDSST